MQHSNSVTALTNPIRVLLGTVSTTVTILLVVAWSLEPDSRGWGTHEQLGLEPCFFRSQFRLPCPTCGMTTSWTYTTRGNFAQAASANLAGTMLCMMVLLALPWMAISALRGRWLLGCPTAVAWMVIGSSWLGIALLDWLQRLLTP